MRQASALVIGILAISLSGCVTAKKVTRERVDQDLAGNKGYMQGSVDTGRTDRPTTREYIDIKVEIPTMAEVKENLSGKKASKERTFDKGATGNQGYIMQTSSSEENIALPAGEEISSYEAKDVIEPASYTQHTVKEGDSLSKIAKQYYGKASKWTLIYEANSDKIKDPNKLKSGMVLVIPGLEDAGSEYVK